MTYKFSSFICDICGNHRKLHNDIEKEKCSSLRKKLHENDQRPRRSKRVYNEKTINYLTKST